MTRHDLIQLGIAAACAALLTGCGKKDVDEPGKNPVTQPAPEQKDTVQLSDESLKLVTINSITVGHGKLSLTLRAPGHVSFNLNHTAKVTSTFG
ncbi:MAG TPA: hypothetical protein VL486_07375 [Verrucomicrobiae bacterium]|nr:hypothetical protein [Verrucomicrobiae bacterium]